MAVSSGIAWQVPTGVPFSASLVDPAGLTAALGARVEAPVTRAIVTAWQQAILTGGVFTVTLDGPLLPGGYQLVWRTNDREPPEFEAFVPLIAVAGLSTGASVPVDFPDVDVLAIRPDVDDVAKLLRTRTVDEGGAEQGTFNTLTRPTGAEVEEIIDQAVDGVLAELRPQFDPRHYRQASRVITLLAALLIEGSYFREQADDKVVDLYRGLHDQALLALQQRIEQDLAQQNLIGAMEPRDMSSWFPRYLS